MFITGVTCTNNSYYLSAIGNEPEYENVSNKVFNSSESNARTSHCCCGWIVFDLHFGNPCLIKINLNPD